MQYKRRKQHSLLHFLNQKVRSGWFSSVTYVGIHSAPRQCLEILKTNHSARNFLEHTEEFRKTNHSVRNFKKPIPVLEVLKNHSVLQILIKTLRYFG